MVESTCTIDRDGNKIYKNTQGQIHREDGPAIEYANGDKFYYVNGKLHREDGPAVEYADGSKHYYLNSKLHREDGPAIERADGDKFYYYQGKQIECSSQKEFEKLIKLKIFW